ncbi:hypothetical protein LSUE1_G007460 [Lachnellula suecica]|uniref:Uncharacterized protein n=1 Tax=Lachnellula suecica TaxID=602035 RepID=A0A8T9CCQ9_9HELO|nr:hypothetical protein LSUE1_G007460 [Lachnellula suecica]
MIQSRHFRKCSRTPITLLLIAISGWVMYNRWGRLHTDLSNGWTVNVIVAATKEGNNYDWAYKLPLPNMQVMPFVADDLTATYHAPANKGHEAMAYLTYIDQFYDALPDISIFVHDADNAWHNDVILESTATYALTHLDLDAVAERGYLNLRVDWGGGCPAWINTSVTLDSPEYTKFKSEEVYLSPFLKEIFPNDPVPEIFGSQCCSQFAVTREAIRSRPKEDYRTQIDWILNTDLEDSVSGRVFEHMWPYLFMGKPVDCIAEFKALCMNYHICFETQDDLDLWNAAHATLEAGHKQYAADKEVGFINDKLDHEMVTLEPMVKRWKEEAIERGRSSWYRWKIAGNI